MSEAGGTTEAEPTPKALPVPERERVASVDVLRGVALMGILAMNIVAFAWPGDVYDIPIMAPGHGRADVALWAFNRLAFDTKMMTLFSMLFGAGLVLMSGRAEARGARIRGVYYRRSLWLLAIGLVHSYLVWDGDILVLYASCGLLLYPTRRWSARALIAVGLVLNFLLVPLLLGLGLVAFPALRAASARAEEESRAGRAPGWWDGKARQVWAGIARADRKPEREDFLGEIAVHRGPYWGMVRERAGGLIWMQTLGFALGGWCFTGGRMLVGMGLMKLGVFSAERSSRTYLAMMAAGYGAGLPVVAFDAIHEARNGFFLDRQVTHALEGWPLLNLYGSLPVAIGHVGAVMLICRAGALPGLTRRLAAAGRMALSCYLFDSVACTTLFYGHGLDLFATLHRPLLYAVVLVIWTAQLLACPLWLEAFRYGPAEWAWRSLTYGKPQPMRARPGRI